MDMYYVEIVNEEIELIMLTAFVSGGIILKQSLLKVSNLKKKISC